MTLRELEIHILRKPNVQKHTIRQWHYIRYTVYDSVFAAIELTEKYGNLLTVYGRYEYYRETYPTHIVTALNNDPKRYTSVVLSGNEVPETVIKSMLDFSYRERLRFIPTLQPVREEKDYLYCGIVSAYDLDQITYDRTHDIAATVFLPQESCETVAADNRETLLNSGKWDNLPYIPSSK